MKVTLPAAMDYTGKHSQAEYNNALEGRFEAQADGDETTGSSGPFRPSHLANDKLATNAER